MEVLDIIDKQDISVFEEIVKVLERRLVDRFLTCSFGITFS